MKYIMIALQGAADHPAEELGGKTPFEVAKIPNLHSFAKNGKVGEVKLVPETLDPASDITLLNLLGYNADKVYTGRGPLEAANLDIELAENEVAFRMNFVTEADGVLADPTGGSITTKEAKALINFLNKKVSNDFVRLYPGAEYRHVAVLKDSHGLDALSAKTTAPEDFAGQGIDGFLPKGPGDELLKKLMSDAKLLLQDHEINQVRVDLQENPANMVWFWGQGKTPTIEAFQAKTGFQGTLVAAMEYAKGMGLLAGLDVMDVQGMTEDPEADYEHRADSVIEALAKNDFVCLHLEVCDEASRMGDMKAKVSALESMDFFIFSKIKEYLESSKDARVLVTPCHASPWKMRRHVQDSVPFVMAGKNVMADDLEKFSELMGKTSEWKVAGGEDLMQAFLAK